MLYVGSILLGGVAGALLLLQHLGAFYAIIFTTLWFFYGWKEWRGVAPFQKHSAQDAATYLDELCGGRERLLSSLYAEKELDETDARRAYIAEQAQALLDRQGAIILPQIRITTHMKVGWFCVAIFLATLVANSFQEPISGEHAQAIIQAVLEEHKKDLPEQVKKDLEELRTSLSDHELSSAEVQAALENAAHEIDKAQRLLESKNEKMQPTAKVVDEEAVPSPTPTTTPTQSNDSQQQKEQQKDQKQEEQKQNEEKREGQKDQKNDKSSQGGGSGESQDKSESNKEDKKEQQGGGSGSGKDQKEQKDKQGQQGESKSQGAQGQEQGDSKQQDQGKEGQDQKGAGKEQQDQGKQGDGKENQSQQNQQGQKGSQDQKQSQALNAAQQAIEALQQNKPNPGKQGKQGSDKKDSGDNDSQKKDGQNGSSGEDGKKDTQGEPKGDKGEGEGKGANKEGQKQLPKTKDDSQSKKKEGSSESGSAGASISQSGAMRTDPKAQNESPYGDNKTLKETEIGEKDEKFDYRYSDKSGEIAQNKNEAKTKTDLSDVTLAKPESSEAREKQPIPLEYKEILQ